MLDSQYSLVCMIIHLCSLIINLSMNEIIKLIWETTYNECEPRNGIDSSQSQKRFFATLKSRNI